MEAAVCLLPPAGKEWNAHYHKRSNVETTFAMIKGKFGDSVRSKTETGQDNEILLKCLCHNICVLVRAMHPRSNVRGRAWRLATPWTCVKRRPPVCPGAFLLLARACTCHNAIAIEGFATGVGWGWATLDALQGHP